MKDGNFVDGEGSVDFELLGQELSNPLNFVKFNKKVKEKQEKPHDKHFKAALTKIKDENRYRVFINIIRSAGQFPNAHHVDGNRDVTVWCSNDYLGMGQNE